MARGGLKKSYDRQKKSRLSDPDLVRSGVNMKDASLLDSIKGGILDAETAMLNTLVDISGSIPTKRNGYGDVVAKYDIDTITSAIDASLTKTRYENETFEKVLDTSISELLPTGGGLSPKEFFANYEQLKDGIPSYAAAASHEYLYSSSLSYLAEEGLGAGEAGEFTELDAPEITVQPIGPRVVSDEVDIEIGPVGAIGLDLKFQWRKDGSEIPNEINDSLVISSTSEDDNGIYTCQISNEAGALLSSDVKLEVIPLYSSGLVESNIIENGGGEKGVTGWTPTAGEIGVRAWTENQHIRQFPSWEQFDQIVADQYPYLQVVDGGEILLHGGDNSVTIVYQDIDLKQIEKALAGKVEGVGGFRYVFYGWLGGHEEDFDYPRCKLEWIDAGNSILDTFEIEMQEGDRKHIVPTGNNSAIILTGFGDERNMFHDFPTDIAEPLLDAITNSWKPVPSGARKAKVSMVMDRGDGTANNAYMDNLSLVMIPLSSEDISDAEEVAEAAEEAVLQAEIEAQDAADKQYENFEEDMDYDEFS